MRTAFENMTTKEKIIVIMLIAPFIAFMICAFIPLALSCFADTEWSIAEGIIHIICGEIVAVALIVKCLTVMQRILNKHNMRLSDFFYGNYEVDEEDTGEDVLAIPEELRSDRWYSALKLQSNIFKVLSIVFLTLYCVSIIMILINELSEIKNLAKIELIPVSRFLILIGTAVSIAETFFDRLLMKTEEKYYENG